MRLLFAALTVAALAVPTLSRAGEAQRISVPGTFETLPQRFDPSVADGTTATVQWRSPGAGDWFALIQGRKLTVKAGVEAGQDLTITVPAADYDKLINGDVEGRWLFTSGSGEVDGSLRLAVKLRRIFPLDRCIQGMPVRSE